LTEQQEGEHEVRPYKIMQRIEARVWTALAGIPVVLVLVALGGVWFKAFCVLLAVIGLSELARAFKSSRDYGGARIIGEVAYPATIYAVCFGLSALWALGILITLGVLAVLFGGREDFKISLASLCSTLFCTLYVSLFALLPVLRSAPNGSNSPSSGAWFCLVLASVWTGDTLAYYGGKRFGKHLLSPLSPKKTREGFLIGLVAAILVAPVGAHFLGLPTSTAALLGLVVGLAAPTGDLLESFFKRELGVKDLGILLPGHGGVLDRCDSLLFAAFAALLVLGAR